MFFLPSDLKRSSEERERDYFLIIERVLKEVHVPVALKISPYGVGVTVNPFAVRPYMEKRVADNFRAVPYSYYYIDGEAFGMYYDDWRPGKFVSESQEAAARVDNLRSVFERYKVPIESEGSSYLFSGSLAVAQGVFFPTLGKRGDPDMELNELSRYFLGRPFPADEPEMFFLHAELKGKYVKLHSDPRYRLPLYESVFHDSVVTTSPITPLRP